MTKPPLCSSCLGVCRWAEDAWVCTVCGDEWYPDHHPRFAPPGAKVLARIHLDGWAGRTTQVVEVIGETPMRYRIKAITDTRLAGRRSLAAGSVGLVPKHAVSFDAPAATS